MRPASFTLTIRNGGDATAHGVALSIAFPDNPAHESNDGQSCPISLSGDGNGHLVGTVGDLAAGASFVCTLIVIGHDGPGALHHPWTVSSTDAGTATGEYDATVDAPGVPPGPPSNDDESNPMPLKPAGDVSLFQSTDGATREVGEPSHAGDAGGASVWFSWTPSFTGTAEVFTDGSDFDTLLDVRDPLTNAVLAANDDASSVASAGASTVCFPVTSGASVLIVADGYLGASGDLALRYGADPGGAPCPGVPPVVSGLSGADPTAPRVGDTLSGSDGTWADIAGGSATWQWDRCIEYGCTPIDGATASTYTVQERDVGTALRLDVTESAVGGTARNTSDPTGVVGQTPSTYANGRIFWASNRGVGLDYEVYSEFPDGSDLTNVSNHSGFDSEPSVSHDGTAASWVQEARSSSPPPTVRASRISASRAHSRPGHPTIRGSRTSKPTASTSRMGSKIPSSSS